MRRDGPGNISFGVLVYQRHASVICPVFRRIRYAKNKVVQFYHTFIAHKYLFIRRYSNNTGSKRNRANRIKDYGDRARWGISTSTVV